MKPKEIKRVDNSLEIIWENKSQKINLISLRKNCPCAGCREAKEEKKSALRVIKNTLNEQTEIKKINLVGNYAIQITWGDDHSTGIYNFEYLYGMTE